VPADLVLGQERVNVLRLNIALDELFGENGIWLK
jgi:hypothetical protein